MSVFYADGYFDLRLILVELVLAALFCAVSLLLSNSFRERRYQRLSSHEVHGMVCAMGVVPIHRALISAHRKLNSRLYQSSIPDEMPAFDPFKAYSDAYSVKYPQYVLLYEAILRLLTDNRYKDMPATYSIDAVDPKNTVVSKKSHGNRTLLQHSLLVSAISMKLSRQFSEKYQPENRARANNPEFKLSGDDPLTGLLGIAHDLGKLVTFNLAHGDDGSVIATRVLRHHDLFGARAISDFPEFWSPEISAEDRSIIQNVLAVYHHPHALPITPIELDADGKYKYRSDRERALLEQLIQSDLVASQLESGLKTSVSLEDLTMPNIDSANDPVTDFKSSFFQFLVGHGLSNRRGKSIGFKAEINGRTLVVIDQNVFLDAFAEHLGKPYICERSPGNIVHPVVGNILQFLEGFGVVHRATGEQNRSPETCVYETKISDMDGREFLTINYALVLDIGECPDFSFLLKSPNTASSFEFVKCKFGAQGTGKAARISTEFAFVQEELFGVKAEDTGISILNLVDDSPEQAPRKRKPRTTKSSVQAKINYAVSCGLLEVHKTYTENEKSYRIFVAQDEWFAANGLPLDKLTEKDKSHLRLHEIKASSSSPGQHVVVLESS